MAYTVDGVEVGPIALGMAGKNSLFSFIPPGASVSRLTPRDGSLSTDDAIAVLKAALDAGVNYWDGSDAYGSDSYNSLVLLNRYFERHPEDAGRAVVNIKGCCKIGAGAGAVAAAIDCSPGAVRACVDECLRQLGGRCRLHHFEVARRDPGVAIEDTAAAMAALAGEGKIGAPGLSEVGAATVRRALAAGCRVEVVEVELSVFSTEPLTNGVARVCAENGITLLAYGHGLLTTKRFEDLPEEGDWRRMLPRFHPDNLPANRALAEAVERLAARKGCTPVQLAINWPRALSRRPGMPRIIPVVGTTSAARVADNARLVDLTDEDLDEMDRILAAHPVKGDRYHPGGMKVLDQ